MLRLEVPSTRASVDAKSLGWCSLSKFSRSGIPRVTELVLPRGMLTVEKELLLAVLVLVLVLVLMKETLDWLEVRG